MAKATYFMPPLGGPYDGKVEAARLVIEARRVALATQQKETTVLCLKCKAATQLQEIDARNPIRWSHTDERFEDYGDLRWTCFHCGTESALPNDKNFPTAGLKSQKNFEVD